MPVEDGGLEPVFHGWAAHPDLPGSLRNGMQSVQQINALRGGGWEAHSKRRHHAIIQTQFVSALQLQLSIVVHKNAMAGSDPHAATVGGADLEELFVQWMTNDALDPTKADGVILQPEAENFSKRVAGQFVHAAAGCMCGE